MTTQELYEKACALPLLPGIYIIRDKSGTIIYIGKAKRLRTRVSQYFRAGVPHEEKVTRMVEAAFEFDVIVTATENEALLLEASQIKTHKPKYNILLKDDKGYKYIKISGDEWPRITSEYKKEKDGADYIGPYMSGFAVNNLVQTTCDSFLLPRCTRRFPQDFGKARPCLYAHIGKCMAVCTGKVKHKTYLETIETATSLIKGSKSGIIKMMEERMEEAAENLEFEKAALLRDQITAIQRMDENQTVIREGEKDLDVIAFAKAPSAACAAVLRFRGGRLCDKREFIFHGTSTTEALQDEFLSRYYLENEADIPKVIAVEAELPEQDALQQVLSEKHGSKVRIYTPERGAAAKQVQTAYVNAVERLARESGRTRREEKTLDELAGLLGLEATPAIIESYDISNWGDGTSVCGMVVFENGKPKKSGYRRFKIKSVLGTDDYASMTEALLRRAAEYDSGAKGQFGQKPDLILLDGGRGQVSAGAAALKDTGLAGVPLFGMVKDNHHRTRGIITQNGEEIALSMHRGPFTFVTAIQDETHRFAIDYQRRAAKGKTFSSTLTSIPGVGPATAKALMAHFKTLRAISEAPKEELNKAKGVNKKAAEAVYNHFHKET